MKRLSVPTHFFLLLCAALLCATAFAKKPPQKWDGLTLVKLKGLDAMYARPGADFSIYHKIIVDPIQVAFAKGWDEEETPSWATSLSANQLEEIKGKISKVAEETFAKEFSEKGGPQIVTAPGPDVLRFSLAIVDVWPNAVHTQEPGRSYVFTTSAGSATLYAELRDSETGRLVSGAWSMRANPAIPAICAGTNSVENAHQARMMVQTWARALRKRYDALRKATAGGDVTAKQ